MSFVLFAIVNEKLRGGKMQFLKDLLRNLLILAVIGIALLIFFPQIMSQVYNTLGLLFGPLIIVLVVVFALPKKTRKKSLK